MTSLHGRLLDRRPLLATMARRAAPLKAHSPQARDAYNLPECGLGGPPEAAVGPRQGQGRRQGEKLSPLGAAVDGTVFVRIDFAPCPIRAVPLQGARAHAQYEHGPQP
jgi:hypothetical protein